MELVINADIARRIGVAFLYCHFEMICISLTIHNGNKDMVLVSIL